MAKKRKVFDIDFVPEDDAATPETEPPLEAKSLNVQGYPLQNEAEAPLRRGPMASAISETSQATASRTETEAQIRAENDALAHEHVRLKKLGLITDLIPLEAVQMTKLRRDRAEMRDPELEELKASIKEVGLANPIRVEQVGGAYELIQGFRRLSAFKELRAETGDMRFAKIPAALVPRGEPLADLYRKMVDENLVRKDVSFGELAELAIVFARDSGIELDDAVGKLYASALKQKRSYIRRFAGLLSQLDGVIAHPHAIPRALGLDLSKRLQDSPEQVQELKELRVAAGQLSELQEPQFLRDFLAQKPKRQLARLKPATAKTSLRLRRPEGEARVLACDGKVELKLARDFSSIPRDELQAAIEALLDRLGGVGAG